jgi:photosystem II stability/assembly factor-like uncharacterized protein
MFYPIAYNAPFWGDLQKPPYWAIIRPTFYAPTRGVLPVHLTDDQGQGTGQIAFYRTDDGGASWSLAAHLTDPALRGQEADEGVTTVQIIDAVSWAVGTNRHLFTTVDGGQTWTVRPAVEHGGGFLTVQLVPDQSGWGLLLMDNCSDACIELMRTKGSGQQWQMVSLPVADKR